MLHPLKKLKLHPKLGPERVHKALMSIHMNENLLAIIRRLPNYFAQFVKSQ